MTIRRKTCRPRKFTLPLSARQSLHRRAYWAQVRGSREVCGVFLADEAGVIQLRFLPNTAKGPGTFELALADARTLPRGRALAGLFHSHVAGPALPGPRDVRGAFFRGFALLYDVIGREAKLYRRLRRGGAFVAKEVPLQVEPGSLWPRRKRGPRPPRGRITTGCT